MKNFSHQAAQGDVMFIRVAALPENLQLVPLPAEDGQHVVAHSETGHHHAVLEREDIQHFQEDPRHAKAMDLLRSFLVVGPSGPAKVEHHRETHTHETINLEPGVYEVRRQREYDPSAGWRVAAD